MVRQIQKIISKRIQELCKEKKVSYYLLSYQSGTPFTTLMHVIDGTSKNPGIITIAKICDGFGITLSEFFNTDDFTDVLKEE